MYIQEISLEINSGVDIVLIEDQFDILMSHYRGSGQTQGKIESQYTSGNKIISLPYTHEDESLHKNYNNRYVNRQTLKIEELCASKLQFSTVGKSYHDYESACKCAKPAFYILITNYLSISSPVKCGNCYMPVPLYKLPEYYDYGYMPILSWESNYISCDTLQMNSEVGERWGLNQMQNFDSSLSKQGREICKKIEELTNTPTYYYLHNYRKIKGDQLKTPCPSCNKKWSLKKQLHSVFDFKCDYCRLVSSVSPNS